jgi:membrane-bound lytic murein transglycosylase A
MLPNHITSKKNYFLEHYALKFVMILKKLYFYMKKLFFTLLFLSLLVAAFSAGYFYHQSTVLPIEPVEITLPPPNIKGIGFDKVPHWDKVNHQKSFQVFQISCKKIIQKNIQITTSTSPFHIQKNKLEAICKIALKTNPHLSQPDAKRFFETHFKAYTLQHPAKKPLFTGYYSPNFEGRLKKEGPYQYPIYAKPQNLLAISLRDFSKNLPDTFIYGKIKNNKFVPYDDRESITKGALAGKTKVIAWVKSPMDSLELEIQGAGIIRTPEQKLYLNYAAQNGKPYQPIGKYLIQEGKISKKNMSMISIRRYFEEHPEDIHRIFNRNHSYVFFKTTPNVTFYGYHNIPLTEGYSMAIDKSIIPIGLPIFLNTRLPNQQPFHRLMISQDVGGAIKGPYRADIYFGTNENAMNIARQMQSLGTYWILRPN